MRNPLVTLGMACLTVVLLGISAPSIRGESQPPSDAGRPPEILSWRHQILAQDRYVELAKQWEAFVGQHPGDARAWVEWGDALRYSDEGAKAREKYAQAFAVDSTNAAAVTAYVGSQLVYAGMTTDWKLALARLRRAMEREPDYPETYYMLWSAALHDGDQALANECLRRMVALGDMPRPLVDCGYNMLVGAPANAIILTNGDNDTYPPLAVQVLSGLRPDVSIVNLSLLNTEWYIRYQRDHGVPIPLSDAQIKDLKATPDNWISTQVARAIYDQLSAQGWPRALCYSVTVYEGNRKLPGPMAIEGLLLRILPATGGETGGPNLDIARTRELFDTVYRIDSMTDPLIDWQREAAVARLGRNYAHLLIQLGTAPPTQDAACDVGAYLYRGIALLAFQHDGEKVAQILKDWVQREPNSPWLARAQKLAPGVTGTSAPE